MNMRQRSDRHQRISWSEIEQSGAAGVVNARFILFEDENSPVVWRSVFPPGCVVSAHSHDCDYVEIILEGAQQVGRTWYNAGDIRIVEGRHVYGPLTAGPDGATVMTIMRGPNDAPRAPKRGGTVTVGGQPLTAGSDAGAPTD